MLGPADPARRLHPADSVGQFQLRQERVGNCLGKPCGLNRLSVKFVKDDEKRDEE